MVHHGLDVFSSIYSNKAWGTGARIASLVGYILFCISPRFFDSLLLVAMIHCPNCLDMM